MKYLPSLYGKHLSSQNCFFSKQLDGHQPKFFRALHSISAYFTSCVFLLQIKILLLIHAIYLEMSYSYATFLVRTRNSAETILLSPVLLILKTIINLLALYPDCCSLIGYATHYLRVFKLKKSIRRKLLSSQSTISS